MEHKYTRLGIFVFLILTIFYFFLTKSYPGPDTVMLFCLLCALLMKRGVDFLRDWGIFFVYFYSYEWVRGHARYVQNFFGIEVHQTTLLSMEQMLFGENIPTYILQRFVGAPGEPNFLDLLSLLIYLSFFFVPVLVCFYLWIKQDKRFRSFQYGYAILCFAALVTYTFFPAYPPWKAAEVGIIPDIVRNTGHIQLGQWMSAVFHTVGYNQYAPVPSLHTGWAWLSSVWMLRIFARRLGVLAYLSFVYVFAMVFAIVYMGDHYVVDAIFGIVYAHLAIKIGDAWLRYKIKSKQNEYKTSPEPSEIEIAL